MSAPTANRSARRRPNTSRRRVVLSALAALALCTGLDAAAPALAQPPTLLNPALPPGFRKPKLQIYPLLDQRDAQSAGRGAVPPAWQDFLRSLSARENLDILGPEQIRSRLLKRAGYMTALNLARQAAKRGVEDHRHVRLESAITELRSALDAFLTLEHELLAPQEVGEVALLLAQAQQEAGHAEEADRSWRRALVLAPSLQLRPGIDSPAAVQALEQARAALAANPPSPPSSFLQPPAELDARTHILRTRLVGDELEVRIQSAGSLRVERQGYKDPEAGDRLASRVWSCLPYGRAEGPPPHRTQLYLNVGPQVGVYAYSPAVEHFVHVGGMVSAYLLVAPQLTFNASVALTNSGRDRSQDLREDVTVARMAMGAGFQWQRNRLMLGAGLSVEGATASDVVITRNVACKHFEAEDGLPASLCDPQRNISHSGRNWQLGPQLNLYLGVRLVDRFSLMTQLTGAAYIYEQVDNGLALPLTLQMGLGYQVF